MEDALKSDFCGLLPPLFLMSYSWLLCPLGKPQNLSFKENRLIWFAVKIAARDRWEATAFSHPSGIQWPCWLGNVVVGSGGILVDPPICRACNIWMAGKELWKCVPLGMLGDLHYSDSIDSKLFWVAALSTSTPTQWEAAFGRYVWCCTHVV